MPITPMLMRSFAPRTDAYDFAFSPIATPAAPIRPCLIKPLLLVMFEHSVNKLLHYLTCLVLFYLKLFSTIYNFVRRIQHGRWSPGPLQLMVAVCVWRSGRAFPARDKSLMSSLSYVAESKLRTKLYFNWSPAADINTVLAAAFHYHVSVIRILFVL